MNPIDIVEWAGAVFLSVVLLAIAAGVAWSVHQSFKK
jgi:hypothetical protein